MKRPTALPYLLASRTAHESLDGESPSAGVGRHLVVVCVLFCLALLASLFHAPPSGAFFFPGSEQAMSTTHPCPSLGDEDTPSDFQPTQDFQSTQGIQSTQDVQSTQGTTASSSTPDPYASISKSNVLSFGLSFEDPLDGSPSEAPNPDDGSGQSGRLFEERHEEVTLAPTVTFLWGVHVPSPELGRREEPQRVSQADPTRPEGPPNLES